MAAPPLPVAHTRMGWDAMGRDDSTRTSFARFGRVAVRVVIPVVFAVGLWFLFTHVVRFGKIVSGSMAPTLQTGDYYVLRLDAYKEGRKPERGDIVVFDRPGEGTFIKRVIGVGGDTLGIARGSVWLNGSWLEEPYLKERPVTEAPFATAVPEGHVFVLGDNRNKSEDSRDYGPVPVANILGQVTKVVWPLARAREFSPIHYAR